jgi:hypothetical protein
MKENCNYEESTMRALDIIYVMNADVTSSVMDKSMSLKDADKRIKLANKFSSLITKGDEGLLELCDWIENDEISDEDAFLLLSDHLGIEL